MAKVYIFGHPFLTYDASPREKYWTALTSEIKRKFGSNTFTNPTEVTNILLAAYSYLVDMFRQLIAEETEFPFFLVTFLLHEESIKIFRKSLDDYDLNGVSETEFSVNRRILKLILEQGCTKDLVWGGKPTNETILVYENKIQELIYLGTWMYAMSENIAYQQMIGDAKEISFVDSGLLSISWKYHYATLFDELIAKMGIEYENAVYDKGAVQELRTEIGKCFAIDFNFAIEQVIQIQMHFNPDQPEIQTIEPYVLPFNLVADSGTTEESARLFYNGLSLSRDNVLSIEDSVYKANSLERYLFRPILTYRINGVDRALIGIEKFNEAFHVIATNAVQFNALPKEWLQNAGLKKYMDKKGHEHDKLYEDEIEKRIRHLGLFYCRNVKSLKQENGNHVKITTQQVGEIDFLIVNLNLKIVFVGESKYNRSRYEGVGYRMDYANFINDYETKLLRKTNWITNNLVIVQQHFRKIYPNAEINLSGFNVQGVFFLNTPTFYTFNGNFKAITLFHFNDFITGKFDMPQLFLPVRYEGKTATLLSTHPYFKPENLQIKIDEN